MVYDQIVLYGILPWCQHSLRVWNDLLCVERDV